MAGRGALHSLCGASVGRDGTSDGMLCGVDLAWASSATAEISSAEGRRTLGTHCWLLVLLHPDVAVPFVFAVGRSDVRDERRCVPVSFAIVVSVSAAALMRRRRTDSEDCRALIAASRTEVGRGVPSCWSLVCTCTVVTLLSTSTHVDGLGYSVIK